VLIYIMYHIAAVLMCQMQFMFSRLASPTVVDFDDDDDDRNGSLPADDQTSSQQYHTNVLQQQQQDSYEKTCHSSVLDSTQSVGQKPNCTIQHAACTERVSCSDVLSVKQQPDCAQKSGLTNVPTVRRQQDCVRQRPDCAETSCDASVSQRQDCTTQQQPTAADSRHCQSGAGQQSGTLCRAALPSDSESVVSLNELLDDCQGDTDAGETYAVDSWDTDDCSPSTVDHLCDIVNMLSMAVNTDPTNVDHIRQISENGLPRLPLNSRPSKSMCNGDELIAQNKTTLVGATDKVQSNFQTVTSPPMQHSFAKSNMSSSSSSSDKGHVDNGYHSNTTSGMSQESAALYDEKSFMLSAALPVST